MNEQLELALIILLPIVMYLAGIITTLLVLDLKDSLRKEQKETIKKQQERINHLENTNYDLYKWLEKQEKKKNGQ